MTAWWRIQETIETLQTQFIHQLTQILTKQLSHISQQQLSQKMSSHLLNHSSKHPIQRVQQSARLWEISMWNDPIKFEIWLYKIMGSLLSSIWSKLFNSERSYNILIVGLANAGKTTLLYRMYTQWYSGLSAKQSKPLQLLGAMLKKLVIKMWSFQHGI